MGLILSLWISARLDRRIGRLDEAAQQMAEGKFGLSVPVQSKDELGRLADSMERMSLRLGQQLHRTLAL